MLFSFSSKLHRLFTYAQTTNEQVLITYAQTTNEQVLRVGEFFV
jgi:hypothetical protein